MPSSNSLSAKFLASTASYNITGTIGCSPDLISKPASVILVRKYWVLRSSLSRNDVVSLNMLNTAIEAPTIAGIIVLLNKYGRERWRSSSIISFLPVVKPPLAPPRALPRVPVIISILPITPRYSCVPLPVFPKKPVAWHSSTIIMALYFSASATITSNCAIVPSIENAPSVTIILERFFWVAFSCSSKSAISLCL